MRTLEWEGAQRRGRGSSGGVARRVPRFSVSVAAKRVTGEAKSGRRRTRFRDAGSGVERVVGAEGSESKGGKQKQGKLRERKDDEAAVEPNRS